MVNELPKEILWLIFQRVIPPVSLLDPSMAAGPDSPWARTLEMKKNLTLVCQGWREVGTCFLYGDITIRRLPQLVSLLHALEGPSGQELGKLIKSLELNCYIPGGSIAVNFGRCLQTLFRLCPSLTRFSYSSQCALPLTIFQYDDPLPASISELSLEKTVDSATIQHILNYVRNNLQYLRIGTPIAEWPSSYESDQPFSTFPSLHTLWIDVCGDRLGPEMNAMATWTLPSLNRLIVSRVYRAESSYAVSDGSTLPVSVAKDAVIKFLNRYGEAIKDLCLHDFSCDEDFLLQLLHCCPSLERLTVDYLYSSDDTSPYHLGPHASLRCVNLLIAKFEGKACIKVDDISSFLGYREICGLPSFAYRWLHEFDTVIDDSFELNLFHHRLVKYDVRIDWNVVESTPRTQDFEDETSSSEASSDIVYDVYELASTTGSDNVSDEGEDWKDVLISGGSVTDLSEDDVVDRDVDAECGIFEALLSEHGSRGIYTQRTHPE
ncbi:hypothetical protein CPB83DRAFT_402294 [Crepidotus variabilis]|uniref:F-box domain-containing protein n=1 Tax=Crepidotus variabilis TaxID=179855 RepID=A0A9P6EEA9_9AGAR|nr:hypothetical protein CPB83DRAFT_402294 [Crepidotus variabilis]